MADTAAIVLEVIRGVGRFMDELQSLSTQAFRLAQRIRGLKEPLAKIEKSGRPYPKEALHQLLDAVQDSRTELETLCRSTIWWRMTNRRRQCGNFIHLSSRIADVVQTLDFGLAVGNWEGEDELDRAQDQEKLLEVLEKMLVTQQDNHDEVMRAITVRIVCSVK